MFQFIHIIGLFGMISVFLIVLYTYKKINKKYKFLPNNEYPKDNKTGELILFYVDWCKYSTAAKTKWDAFVLNNKNPNISFNQINCDTQPALAESYNIDEYPTIIMLSNKKKYIYDTKMDPDTLNEFIHAVLK